MTDSRNKRSRFRRLALLAMAGLAAAALLLAAWGFFEPNRLVVKRASLRVPEWRGPALRFAVISDIHMGSAYMDEAKVDRLVAMANAESPDITVLLGDYIPGWRGRTPVAPERVARRLAGLRARLGVYAVLGNHDLWFDRQQSTEALRSAGLVLLVNESIEVRDGAQSIWLAGLDDPVAGGPDIQATLRSVPADGFVVLLSHSPDVFPTLPPRIRLMFAGHTHGGQIALPLLGRPVVPSQFGERYAAGHVAEGGRHLFVTTGVGTSILPVRIGVPPEIALVTVRSGP